jgi:hypothetical protein
VIIQAVNVGAGVVSGIDPGNTMVARAPVVSDSGVMVSSVLSGGLNGCCYIVECLAMLDDGETLALLCKLPVVGYINEVPPTPPPDVGTNVVTETGALWVTETGTYVIE